jgi:MoaA/NifB/PqqE/SkfB family radical SAM enzyme
MMKKTVAFTRDAVNVFFHILTACNLKCRHCYINPAQHGTETLPVETAEKWLDLFADRAPRANLVLLGGEPTLHPDLARIIKAARRRGFKSVTVDTNGGLFHDLLAKIMPHDLDYLSFSLDGATPETNDAIRGQGSYELCLSGLRAALSKGFSTSLIYTVSRRNIYELSRMGPLLEELGVRRFFIQVIGIRGKSACEPSDPLQVSKDLWLATVPAAAEEIARRGIRVIYPKVFLNAGENFECAGRVAENFFIFPNGRVYRCPLCEDYPLHSLRIEDGRLIETDPINETHLFQLDIPEGCVMNKLIQPGNITYGADGIPAHRIACCLLKEEVSPPTMVNGQ